MEYALIPMSNLKITQGRFESPSHQSRNAYDLGGIDTGIESLVAPFTAKVEYVSSSSLVLLSNVNQVKLSNGSVYDPYTLQAYYFHDNDVSDLSVGDILPQGTVFYQEGTYGNAQGNHVHMQMADTPYQGGYPLIEISTDIWDLKGNKVNIEDFYFITQSTNVIDTNGYTFKYVENEEGEEEELLNAKIKNYRFVLFRKKPTGF
jgi:murein DD-endopeptidase MepM/ murein hydrolase activator NlpD